MTNAVAVGHRAASGWLVMRGSSDGIAVIAADGRPRQSWQTGMKASCSLELPEIELLALKLHARKQSLYTRHRA